MTFRQWLTLLGQERAHCLIIVRFFWATSDPWNLFISPKTPIFLPSWTEVWRLEPIEVCLDQPQVIFFLSYMPKILSLSVFIKSPALPWFATVQKTSWEKHQKWGISIDSQERPNQTHGGSYFYLGFLIENRWSKFMNDCKNIIFGPRIFRHRKRKKFLIKKLEIQWLLVVLFKSSSKKRWNLQAKLYTLLRSIVMVAESDFENLGIESAYKFIPQTLKTAASLVKM